MGCPCNSFLEQPSGGFRFGSAVHVVLDSTLPSGGFIFGSATVPDVGTQLWDDWVSIWHLNEHGTGAAGEYKDSGQHGYNGTGGNGDATTVPTQDTGLLCNECQDCNGRQFILAPQDYVGTFSAFFVRAWIKVNSDFTPRSFYGRGGSSPTDFWQMTFGHTYLKEVSASVQLMVDGVPTKYVCNGRTRMAKDQWYLAAALWVPGKSLSVYLNSSEADNSISVAATTFAPTTIGQTISGWNTGAYFIGDIQDVWTSTDPYRVNELTNDVAAWCGGDYSVSPTQSPEYS